MKRLNRRTAITLVLASIVGLVIVAVLVPLYDLTGAIG